MTVQRHELVRGRRTGLGSGQCSAGHVLCRILAGERDPSLWVGVDAVRWREVSEIALAEGVAPLLCAVLDGTGWPPGVPDAVRLKLQAARYGVMACNLRLYSRLLPLLSCLWEPARIRPVLLKGAALAVTLYEDLGLRPMSDIDILVPQSRVAEAVERARAYGYREQGPELGAGLGHLTHHHVALIGGGGGFALPVEIHWSLTAASCDRHYPDMAWFWEEVEPLSLVELANRASIPLERDAHHADAFVLMLSPTAQLLHLAAHLMLQHGAAQARLLWFYDIHLLVEQEGPRIRWLDVTDRARGFRWSAAVRAALVGTQDRFGTFLPEDVLARLAADPDVRSARLVDRKAMPVQTRATGVWNRLESLDWRGRLRLGWAMILPSPEYVRHRYRPEPSWLWPVCYPCRWFDIVREGITTLWRRARQRALRDA